MGVKREVNKKSHSTSKYTWNGVFLTWEEACKAGNSDGEKVLRTDRWLRRICQQLFDYEKDLADYGIAMSPRPCNLPLVCGLIQPKSILDFGGSSGWGWNYLLQTVPDTTVKAYLVVETEEVVGFMKGQLDAASPLQYKTLGQEINSFDLLYCNSVLQYFESNWPLKSLIGKTNSEYILLDDLVAFGVNDFFTTQRYYDHEIPYRFIGLEKLLSQLQRLGYKEIVRLPYASPILNVTKPIDMENFPEDKRLRYSLSILLKKI